MSAMPKQQMSTVQQVKPSTAAFASESTRNVSSLTMQQGIAYYAPKGTNGLTLPSLASGSSVQLGSTMDLESALTSAQLAVKIMIR